MFECAFDRGNDKCLALTEQDCMNCRFFKTKEEVKENRRLVKEHISKLPDDVKAKIIRTYYRKDGLFW